MSQGCNFFAASMSASRRRSTSVTPQPPTAVKGSPAINNDANNGRRASSSDDLAVVVEPSSLAGNRSASGNHLAVGASNETICDTTDLTQTNNNGYMQQADLSKMRALRIETNNSHNSMDLLYEDQMMNEEHHHPINLDDILQIDLDSLHLEEECKNLESQVEYWEQKVAELERKRFTDDVNSKLAVERVLKQRKKLRDLEFEIYKLNLESEDSDPQSSNNLSPYNDEQDNYPIGNYESRNIHRESFADSVGSKIITSRFGSHIRPGQENTADILEAIPPSGALQHRHYLSRASTGTDSSEYSQIPTYDQHRHQIHHHHQHHRSNNQHHQHHQYELRSSDSNEESDVFRRHHHQQHLSRHHVHHQYKRSSSRQSSLRRREVEEEERRMTTRIEAANLQTENNRRRVSPIRPNHFKGDFASPHMIAKQDSSSTTSSGSPSH